MSKLQSGPYVNFQSRAREAMEYYHKVLGGKLDLQTLNEQGVSKPAAPGERISDARFEADAVGPDRLIHRRNVNQFVVHQDVHAVVSGDRLECEVERSDLDGHRIPRHHRGAGVPRVGNIGEEQDDVV